MTVSYLGADPDLLDALGRLLGDGADRLELLRSSVGLDLFYGGWIGADADTARSDWEQTHGPALAAAAELLTVMGTNARSNAQAQRDASASDYYQTGPNGWPPPDYPGDGDPEALRQYWVNIAAANAGIDLSQWDPTLGAENQSAIIEAVYTYYANLYLNNPYMLWAGMAAMVGPAFAGGFYDLGSFRDIAQAIQNYSFLPIPGVGIGVLANISDSELQYYETTFLTMQKDIFFDQGMMHEAYLGGGMAAIQDLYDAGLIDFPTLEAWQQIDQGRLLGDTTMIEDGNAQLLYREQHDVIDGYYQDMYNHGLTGPAFTYMLGAVGEAGIPGTMTFADWDPLVVTVDAIPLIGTPLIPDFGLDAYVNTPFPDGNLAIFEDRWEYISGDTLPAFQAMVREHPDQVSQILSTPVGDRIDAVRLGNRVDDLIRRFTTDWGIDGFGIG